MIILSRRTFAVIAVAIATMILALGTGFQIYFHICYLTILVLLFSFIWSFVNLHWISLTIHRSYQTLRVGNYLQSNITIENSGPLPAFGLEINELSEIPGHTSATVVNVSPYQKLQMTINVPLKKRGVYQVFEPSITSTDPFGIYRLRYQNRRSEELVIFPKVVEIPVPSLGEGEISGEGGIHRSTPDATSSVATIREYQPGESYKFIHWPSTARSNSLMLKQFDTGMEDITWILLDLNKNAHSGWDIENTEEYSITAAASIAKAYSSIGWSVGLMAHGKRQHILPPHQGVYGLEQIMTALTEARSEGEVLFEDLLYQWRSHTLSQATSINIITPSTEIGWSVLLESLVSQGLQASAIIVDSGSFGGRSNHELLIRRLQRKYIRTYMLRYGEDIRQSLIEPMRLADERSETIPGPSNSVQYPARTKEKT